ncbi:FHA domain-containing protein [Myxococcus sp. MxC21-1]|uniref:FHA domain-containing protein n=1 Tax=Myxococcus sp. MxC21-1 TaxID=3041439 RepID=UPI00292FA8DC|nr:FHA domain-containing protein [Myxococcus sp. MxC21-1]WNZ64235.1 FHA domain-containing protein [Myxococcus sp. MxC21-1]
MPQLLVLPDGRRLPLDKPVVSVGSDATCDAVLLAPGVKPSHALLFRDARGWSVSPAGKGCDIKVRGRRVDLAPLEPGDRFRVGTVELELIEAVESVVGDAAEVAPGDRTAGWWRCWRSCPRGCWCSALPWSCWRWRCGGSPTWWARTWASSSPRTLGRDLGACCVPRAPDPTRRWWTASWTGC